MFPSSESMSFEPEKSQKQPLSRKTYFFISTLRACMYSKEPKYEVYKHCNPFLVSELKTHIPLIVERFLKEHDTVQVGQAGLQTFLDYTLFQWKGPSWEEARSVVLGDMLKVLPTIDKIIKQSSQEQKRSALFLLFQIRRLFQEGDKKTLDTEALIAQTEDILHAEKDTVLHALQRVEDLQFESDFFQGLDYASLEYFSMIASYIAYAKPEDAEAIEVRVDAVFDTLGQRGRTDFIPYLFDENTERTYEIGERYFDKLVVLGGIADHMDTFWEDVESTGFSESEILDRRASLAWAIEELLQEGKDVPRVLHEVYGIVNFNRYRLDTLKEMYHDFQYPTHEKYVLGVYPRSDWNKAFVNNITKHKQTNVSELGYKIRVIEVGNLEELILRGIQIKKLFGQASGIIFGGHGTGNSIQLDSDVFISAEDFETQAGRILKKGLDRFLTPGSTIVLHSCSAGITGGIAQQISREYGKSIIGADTDTNIHTITGSVSDSHVLTMKATFNEGFPRTYTNGVLFSLQ
jgi:hypothetical protein